MMMVAREHFPQFTPLEYLEWEAQQELRHEFLDGKIYAMTSESANHDGITANFCSIVQNHLQSSVCRVFSSDVKVQTLEANSFCYPDISVTCDVQDRSANNFITHPCLIIEVLSPSTEAYDRGDKFALYRRSSSLQEYVVVSTNVMRLDVHQRNEGDRWKLISYEAGDLVELKSVNLSFSIDLVYEDIIFEKKSAEI